MKRGLLLLVAVHVVAARATQDSIIDWSVLDVAPTKWDVELFHSGDRSGMKHARCKCRCYSCGACISTHAPCVYYAAYGCHVHCHHMDTCVASIKKGRQELMDYSRALEMSHDDQKELLRKLTAFAAHVSLTWGTSQPVIPTGDKSWNETHCSLDEQLA